MAVVDVLPGTMSNNCPRPISTILAARAFQSNCRCRHTKHSSRRTTDVSPTRLVSNAPTRCPKHSTAMSNRYRLRSQLRRDLSEPTATRLIRSQRPTRAVNRSQQRRDPRILPSDNPAPQPSSSNNDDACATPTAPPTHTQAGPSTPLAFSPSGHNTRNLVSAPDAEHAPATAHRPRRQRRAPQHHPTPPTAHKHA